VDLNQETKAGNDKEVKISNPKEMDLRIFKTHRTAQKIIEMKPRFLTRFLLLNPTKLGNLLL